MDAMGYTLPETHVANIFWEFISFRAGGPAYWLLQIDLILSIDIFLPL